MEKELFISNSMMDWLKDEIAILGKPDSLNELVQVTQCYDNLYWERMEEHKFTHRKDFRPTTSSSWPSDPWTPITPFWTPQQPPYPSQQNTPWVPQPHIGPDGKLKPEEANRHHENNLCLMCGKADHKITACPSATRVRAAILQETEALGPPTEIKPTDVKQENESATPHIQHQWRVAL